MQSKVLVLMAAYNGNKWIVEQIESILNQEDVDVSICVSVDKSSDGTERIIHDLSLKYNNISYLPFGEVFGGAAKNFFRLILEADVQKFDYIAFADQDDIWFADKLRRAVSVLNEYDFYSSNVTAFWNDGRKIDVIKSQPMVKYDYVFEAGGPGCTYVIRKDVFFKLKYFIENNKDQVLSLYLHDWFVYAFARSSNFTWFIDDRSSMLYRQHENNQVGANNSLKSFLKRFKLIQKKWYRTEIEKLIAVLSLRDDPFLNKALYNGYFGNLYLAVNIAKLRRRKRDRFLLMFALLINIF